MWHEKVKLTCEFKTFDLYLLEWYWCGVKWVLEMESIGIIAGVELPLSSWNFGLIDWKINVEGNITKVTNTFR